MTRHLEITEKCSSDVGCSPGFSRLSHPCVCVFCRKLIFCLGFPLSVFSGLCLCLPFSGHVRERAYMCYQNADELCRLSLAVLSGALCVSCLCAGVFMKLKKASEPPTPLRHMDPSSFGVCLSIHQFILIAQSRDSWIVITIYCTVSPLG